MRTTLAPSSLFRAGKILIYVNTDYHKLHCMTCHKCRSNTGQVQFLVTAPPICDEYTDTTSDDSEEEIIEEFGSSDFTLDGELHPQLTTTTRSGRVAGSWRNVLI